MVQSLTIGDFNGVTQALADAGLKLEGDVDFTALLNLVGVLLGNSQSDGDVDDAEEDENDTVGVGMQIRRSIGAIPIDLLLVGRGLGLLVGITRQLDAGMDTMEIVAHYT